MLLGEINAMNSLVHCDCGLATMSGEVTSASEASWAIPRTLKGSVSNEKTVPIDSKDASATLATDVNFIYFLLSVAPHYILIGLISFTGWTRSKLAPRGAWLRQKSRQEISCAVVALLVLKKCVSSDAL